MALSLICVQCLAEGCLRQVAAAFWLPFVLRNTTSLRNGNEQVCNMINDLNDDPIDAVITWVDGNDPAHRAKRNQYMAQSLEALHENASNPHRWEQSDEIYFCLHSIHNHAPWIRTIWIVVDEAAPDLARLSQPLRDKIRVVFHRDIFEGHGDVLPTFNSLAIESMMWRINGLAERFLYFNDDVFLTAPLLPRDMFDGAAPVLRRGAWVDYAALVVDHKARADPAFFNHYMLINAARLCGVQAERLFACAHVVHPMRRSVMAELFDRHFDEFMQNIGHRFRHLSQFSPLGLHTQACIDANAYQLGPQDDHLHITSGHGADQPSGDTRALLTAEGLAEVKVLCVNDLPQLEALVPDARLLIRDAVGMA